VRYISLFSGIAGLDRAIDALGGDCWVQVEKEPYCRSILDLRYPDVPKVDNIFGWHATADTVDLVIGGPPCFVAGTLIETKRGLLPIEQVEVGDEVLTHRRRWRAVNEVHRRQAAATRSVKALGLRSTTTDEHPYWVRVKGRAWNNDRRQYDRTFGTPHWVEAGKLTTDHYIALVADSHGDGDAPPVERAYVMGRWLADGWKADYPRKDRPSNHRRVMFSVGKHREQGLRSALIAAGLVSQRVEERTAVKYHVVDHALFDALEPFGYGAGSKRVPIQVLSWPAAQRAALLDGWLVDGGVTISRELAFGMARLARSLALAPTMDYHEVAPTTVIEGRTVNQQPWWRLRFHETTREPFFEDGILWSPVRSTTAGGAAAVYNLSVEEDESYVADGAIVHNCQPVSHAGRRKGTEDDRWLWGEGLRVVREAKPARVFFENPMGLRTLGLDAILAELSDMGYGGAWEVVAAADVGAPHLRKRIFIMGIRGHTGWEGPTRPPGNRRVLWPSPNASGERPNEGNVRLLRQRVLDGTMTEDEAAGMLNGKSVFSAQGKVPAHIPTPTARLGGERGPQAKLYFDPARSNDLDDYVAAYPTVDRWPTPTSRDYKDTGDSIANGTVPVNGLPGRAVGPSVARGALSPDWVEWLMNLPIGWTDIGAEPGPLYGWESEPDIPRVGLGIPNRSKRLTALGNAVVPAQAVFAWNRLMERLG
jgi:site-specific DNA-cytosine methylase